VREIRRSGAAAHADQPRMRRVLGAHAEVRDVDVRAHRARERVDRGEAREEPADHLRGDVTGIRAHAVVRDAVVGRADQDRAPLERVVRNAARDRAQPHRKIFDPAEAVQRLGQLVDAPACGRRDARIGRRDRRNGACAHRPLVLSDAGRSSRCGEELTGAASTFRARPAGKPIVNDTRRLYPTEAAPQRALVVAVDLQDPQRPLAAELAEFVALAKAAGAVVVDEIVQKLPRVDPATLVGSGKAREIAERADELNADVLFVFNDLRPRQRTNLEKIVPLPIVDRTMLILDIFAQHARSREGQLQVELAQLRYRQSNLIGAGAALSRLGGGVGTRGPGETKLETDRRRIAQRVTLLQRQLDEVRKQRETRRSGRGRDPFVALVGYTNVGKSSLLNRLAGAGANDGAFVADQPFATLDPTLRRAYLAPGVNVRLADTVGFITALPQELVNAFRATLEELDAADLLLHVHDASNPDWPRQNESVETILRELKLDEKPVIDVFNKIDRVDAAARTALPPGAIEVSASSGEGLDALREGITERLRAN
jgi:GTP-binding protein HflX